MTEQILQKWLDSIKGDLIANYDRLGLRASGDWAKSLKTFIEDKQTSFRLGIIGNRYTGALTDGRRPNKNQSDEAIRKWVGWAGSTFIADWVKKKGISANPYAVAYKIAKEGWKVPNKHNQGGLVSDVLTRDRLRELNRGLVGFYIDDFRSKTVKDLTSGN